MKVSEIKIGETYNGVKVLEDLGCFYPKDSHRAYKCLCPTCGSEFVVTSRVIGLISQCRDCKYPSLIGQRFGKLTVIERIGSLGGCSYWKCQCDCGGFKNVKSKHLKSGAVVSCGCISMSDKYKKRRKEGIISKMRFIVSPNFNFDKPISTHPLYSTWNTMIQRCSNPNKSSYKEYGQRGIKVCARWQPHNQGFENFLADMGERPSKKHSIDRIDVNGNYCPENCRWALPRVQSRNTRRNSYVLVRGKEMTVADFCDWAKLKRGWFYTSMLQGVDVNYLVQNSNKYRKGKRQLRDKFINFNREVTEETILLIENNK